MQRGGQNVVLFRNRLDEGTSLMVQWLRLPSNALSTGLIPDQGTKILHTIWCGQTNFLKNRLDEKTVPRGWR